MGKIKCPVCHQYHDHLVHRFHKDLDRPLVQLLQEEQPDWKVAEGACTRCLDQAQLELFLPLLKGVGDPGEVNGYKILPTPIRLRSGDGLTGKNISICFIDSGFFPHPDLVCPQNRILKMVDITNPYHDDEYFAKPHKESWHGMMTSVACAGNGQLSEGLYKGLACEATLVLLKVMDEKGAISGQNITKAIHWAINNRKEYNIRIINLSVTDDEPESFRKSAVDKAIQLAVARGITVIAAAGNDPNAPIRPPANAPHAITVGGLNDRNTLDPLFSTLYNSTFGETEDALQKPDLIAPAIWIAAPLLPGSEQQREAEALFDLWNSGDAALKAKLANLLHFTQLDKNIIADDLSTIREEIGNRITQANYISPHYQHVDGTSFAAPIVSSVIAQMLEANPRLTPALIREILLVTARNLPKEEASRQGWGIIQPYHAVNMAAAKPLLPTPEITPVIDNRSKIVTFYLDDEQARQVALTGDFLQWSAKGIPLDKDKQGIWSVSLPLLSKGTYRYKFIIDRNAWICDPRNLYREVDHFNGFNSKLIIE